MHEQIVRRHLQDHIIGHISRDATEIEAREKPRRRSSDDPPPPAPPKRKRGRPRKDEVLPPKPLTRIEQQRTQSLDEMRAALPTQCDVGVKRNSKGFRETWIGYKLHLDTANGIIPVAAILTAASIHDSQVAIPLARTSEERVVWLYDLMDSAYDAQPIIDDCLAAGRVPVIDRNTRRDTALKAEIAAERARRRLIKLPDPRDLTYNERTTAERANARIKDEFGGRYLRVRGHLKAFCSPDVRRRCTSSRADRHRPAVQRPILYPPRLMSQCAGRKSGVSGFLQEARMLKYLVVGLIVISSLSGARLAQTSAPPANPKPSTPAVTTKNTPPPADPAAGRY